MRRERGDDDSTWWEDGFVCGGKMQEGIFVAAETQAENARLGLGEDAGR